ncbi:putative disease resistance protein At3g14460 [Herrania umbratica]|uniref:Disease resistance protein At3g14460 n=1 Tax=Herrania umbratica TaxID=108875 RepID=A0A6J1BCB9_9ROSI|nr:putative disease resistance protein At3g14460 [Herrania umbratica]
MAALSTSIPVVLGKLSSISEFPNKPKKFAANLQTLDSSLMKISYLIRGAEENQQDEGLKNWLQKIEDVVYDADNLADELLYEDTRCKRDPESQKRGLWARTFNPSFGERYGKAMQSEIKLIVELIDFLVMEKPNFNFPKKRVSHKLQTTPVVDATEVVGRDEDRRHIIDLLLSGDADLDGIAIIGMGGCGKTTLAQLVYGDVLVRRHFDLTAWISVSFDFDVMKITRMILEAITRHIPEGSDLNLLQSRLRESLAGKRFLLVLDDVWNEDIKKWDLLRTPLNDGGWGSKILITTRNAEVADVMGCSTRYQLRLLTNQDCWHVFNKSAFAKMSETDAKDLEDIGKEIVKKCHGLPLAAKSIGSRLLFRRSRPEWYHVLKSISLEFRHESFFPILRLSYDHLPAHLKPCFAYCSLFPSDFEFEKEKLILLWMAAALLVPSAFGGLSMEQVGANYFDGLLNRSFFTPVGGSYFKMHDRIHDLASFASEGVCLRLEGNCSIPKGTRHLSIVTGQYDTPGRLYCTDEANRLRTLFLINSPLDHGSSQLRSYAVENILARQQRLRVLLLSHFQEAQFPDSIGKLKHLRYLDLSESALQSLPESLCTLYFLETLILTNCVNLIMLPRNVVKLFNLRHLHIKGTGLQQMPEEMSRLKRLQTLTNFIVGNGQKIKELGALIALHGTLSVSKLQNISSSSDASYAKLKAKKYLNELHLEWSDSESDPVKDTAVLENLEPSKGLKKLTIRFYGGTKFPSWLGDSSFSNIVFLCLRDCNNCSSLPPLGQLPSLEHLIIERIINVSSIGHEFYRVDESVSKPFQSLKTLTFERMPRWEQWVSLQGEEFPCLQKLNLTDCPNLKGGLPKSLPSLVELRISECQQLADLLPRVPESCKLELSNCDKVRLRSIGGNLSRNDGEEASRFPSSMFEISGHDSFSIPEHSIPSKKVDDSFGFPEHSIPSKKPDEFFGFLQSSTPSDERLDDSFLFPEHFIPSKKLDDSFSSPSSVAFKVSSITKLMELPPGLPSLKIERCDALESLPTGTLDRPLLQRLYIVDCDSLKTFPQLHQPSSLKRLYIHNCRNLEFPQHNEIANQFILLEHLCLGSSCDSLGSFRLDSFPNLKTLSLWDCKKLEYLSMEKGSQNDLKSLEVLEIRDCPNLTTFPEEGLEAPSLTSLVLSNCNNLKSLPQWMQNLTSLQSLHINKCRELQPLPPWRLPSSLNILCISFCDKIIPQTGWELHKLHSLSNFEIEGGCQDMLSFPENRLLPTNLNSLRISSLSSLKSLDKTGLQQLTSLQSLEINGCNELRSLPEEGLPSSLCHLSITDCSSLNSKLEKRKGKEWFKIAHIPSIHLG